MHEKKKNTANRLHTLTLALSLYVHFCTSVSAADFSRIQKQMVNIFGEIKVGWDKETDKKVTIIAGNDEKFEEGTKHAEGLVIDLRGRHLEYNRENPHDQKPMKFTTWRRPFKMSWAKPTMWWLKYFKITPPETTSILNMTRAGLMTRIGMRWQLMFIKNAGLS